jgi:kynureninase
MSNTESKAFSVITPPEAQRRGAQISLRIPGKGREWCAKLASMGVIGDWREPDIFRVAPIPLYNSFFDVYRFVQKFAAAV